MIKREKKKTKQQINYRFLRLQSLRFFYITGQTLTGSIINSKHLYKNDWNCPVNRTRQSLCYSWTFWKYIYWLSGRVTVSFKLETAWFFSVLVAIVKKQLYKFMHKLFDYFKVSLLSKADKIHLPTLLKFTNTIHLICWIGECWFYVGSVLLKKQ